jgi:glycosyltransferase involved in cell wall biosynthesis
MRFSVVIAAYQAADTVAEAIESVLAQTRGDFEVIVVDDGSTDETGPIAQAIAAKDGRVMVVRQANAGPSAARNRGISAGTGEYVSMLDSDDLWLPEYLERMGDALDRDRDAGFAYTEAWELNAASGRFLKVTAMAGQHPPRQTLSHERFVAELMQRNFVYNAVTVRRSVLDEVGSYDEEMSYSEDYELWLRIATAGFNAARVPGPLAIKRALPSSLTSNREAMEAGVRRAYGSVLERDRASARARALAMQRLEELRAADGRRARRSERLLLVLRRALAAVTRGLRYRFKQSSAPPPGVAEAFPGLGLGDGAGRGQRR